MYIATPIEAAYMCCETVFTAKQHGIEEIMEGCSKKLLLLQINDALFPIGGYSHSYGLETYIQKDLVKDVRTARQYIDNNLLFNLCYTEGLSVRLAYEYAKKYNIRRIFELEEIIEASRLPAELRSASHKLGSRFIKTLDAMGVDCKNEVWKQYTGRRKAKNYQHAVAYGVFCSVSQMEEEDMLLSYLYAQTSAMVTNCVKTIPLSQSAGQNLLFESHVILKQAVEKIMRLTEDELYSSMPGFDIRSMQHECLYSRLYMS